MLLSKLNYNGFTSRIDFLYKENHKAQQNAAMTIDVTPNIFSLSVRLGCI
jgi:hypothetical protein